MDELEQEHFHEHEHTHEHDHAHPHEHDHADGHKHPHHHENTKYVQNRLARVYEIFPRLRERRAQFAGTMSGGEQAMVSIGRGLMNEPRLLIIDEPSLGLSPALISENFRVIRSTCESGIAVFLVEQNVRQTLAIAHQGYVLSQGRIVAGGTAKELKENAEVLKAYFG